MKNTLLTPILVALFCFELQGAEIYVDQAFTGKTQEDWTFTKSAGDGAYLTAVDGTDPDGEGWLRLTKNATNQSSFVYYNNAISSANGLVFNFDFVVWSKGSVGDGFALAIFDAATQTPSPGGYGGSLGYAQRYSIGGLAGGIVGFGFDSFGNYSTSDEGHVGGPGKSPNTIAVRGSMGADRTSGYDYITGVSVGDSFSEKNATSRDDATIHSVRITIPTDKKLSIEMTDTNGVWQTLIDEFQCTLTCPEEIKFGFTAGTGSVSANQEIRNLTVTSIPEPTSLSMISLIFVAGFWIRRRFLI